MTQTKLYSVPEHIAKHTHINEEDYHRLYHQSIKAPDAFWAEQANKFITWFSPFEQALEGNFNTLDINWFSKGSLNACYNCLDRHLEARKDQVALIWESDDPNLSRSITYHELYQQVCRFASALKSLGIEKGDRVCIYLPMIPEATIAMLACARIGAIHSVVFGGFSPASLQSRMQDANCSLLITADEGIRGNKLIPLKENADKALENAPQVNNVIVVKRTGNPIAWEYSRDHWYHELMETASIDCPAEPMLATDPLFILYTSGSTGKPKGILHNTGGYMVYAAMTHQYIFDYQNEEIFWCTADVGWITGHTYLVYGPLANGATTVMFEGVPHHPDFSRFWQIIDKHQVNIFYTAPTAIRALRREGDHWVKKTERTSLRILGSVGEPINPDVWEWYYHVVGDKRCPIVDTWWQTETGGIMISAFPGATPLAPGSASWPFFGVVPEIVDEHGQAVTENAHGKLIIKQPWPGIFKTIYRDHQRFIDTYFSEVPGNYLTGDGAYRDSNGYYWITGRNDDVINVSGHRIGSEELESALLTHPDVSEAAVVGVPDEITGERIYAYITTKASVTPNDELKTALNDHIREEIGPIALLKQVHWTASLPKTRSGKIMRRILRKIANGEYEQLGDTSTLAEPNIVEELIKNKK